MYKGKLVGRIMCNTVDADTKLTRLMDNTRTYRFRNCCEQSADCPLGLNDCFFFFLSSLPCWYSRDAASP